MPERTDQRRLSFGVEHRYDRLKDRGIVDPIGASVKIAGEIAIDQDLAAGERLTVVVTGADGEVLGHAIVIASPPSFAAIEDKDIGVLGFERRHKLKVDPFQHPELRP